MLVSNINVKKIKFKTLLGKTDSLIDTYSPLKKSLKLNENVYQKVLSIKVFYNESPYRVKLLKKAHKLILLDFSKKYQRSEKW